MKRERRGEVLRRFLFGSSLLSPARWNRDYLIRGAGFRCDDAHNPLAANEWDYQQAIRIGGRGLIRLARKMPSEVIELIERSRTI